jgi:surface carbohydrate biosynthesis protein (TIGR04326 family)
MTTGWVHARGPVPGEGADVLILWDALMPPDGFSGRWVSAPELVRQQRIPLRAEYLQWLADVGEERVGGRTLTERLTIRGGSSYWWMCAPSEYSFNSTSLSYAVVRLMAVCRWADEHGVNGITSGLTDRAANQTLADWCQRTGRRFSVSTREHETGRARTLLSLAMRRWVRGWRDARGANRDAVPGPRGPRSTALIIDYLAHVERTESGLRSGYWGTLPELLRSRGVSIDWLHVFVPTAQTLTIRAAEELASHLTSPAESHAVVQGQLSFTDLMRALADYGTLRLRLRDVRRRPPGPTLGDLQPWPLLLQSLTSDLAGGPAMDNCLWIRAFDHYLRELPHQVMGIYVQENQPWELAMIGAWRSHGHGLLVGVPHTTVRFWDLRYVRAATSQDPAHSPMPLPDISVLNGPAAESGLDGYPPLGRDVRRGEALRFIGKSAGVIESRRRRRAGDPRLLVIAEYDPGYAEDQAALARAACDLADQGDMRIDLVWRPHPAATGTLPRLPEQARVDPRTPLDTLLAETDLVLSGDFSSAILQAHALGIAVITMPPSLTFGNDTTEGIDAGTPTPEDVVTLLAASITDEAEAESTREPLDRTFYLDPALPLWGELLDTVGLTADD